MNRPVEVTPGTIVPPAPATAGGTTLDARLDARIDALCADGRATFGRFNDTVRSQGFHPFMPADYDLVRSVLLRLRTPGARFLEWGSATGVIAIMADLLGFQATGIECDPSLVATSRELAARHRSRARFACGSFLPDGYVWHTPDGDPRTGTIEDAPAGYPILGHTLAEADIVWGYPWGGEEGLMRDVMQRCGRADAMLLLYDASGMVRGYRGGHDPEIAPV